MVTSSSVIVPVRELLGRNNYQKWSIFMKHYLVSQDLWDIVQSSQVPEELEEKKEWDRKNALALHVITISCEANVLDEIIKDINSVSAKTVWDTLASINPIREHVVQINDEKGNIGPERKAMSELLDCLAMGKLTILLTNYLEKASENDDLLTKDKNGDTALSLAAQNGRVDIAKLLVEKKPDLLTIQDAKGKIPVQWACERCYEEAALFLFRETPLEALDPETGGCGLELLIECMNKKLFDGFKIAPHGLLWIFSKQVTIVILISIVVMKLLQLPVLLLWRLLQKFWKLLGIKQIYDLKLNNFYAKKVLEFIFSRLGELDQKELVQMGAVEATLFAIKNGIPEIAVGFINANENILWSLLHLESHSGNLFVTAVKERQEDVARFLYESYHRVVSSTIAFKDAQGNNILHVAAKLAPDAQLTHISSAALQLQSELRWFKAVEDIFSPFFNKHQNRDGETPSQVFIREHKSLLKEAEGWMKKTSESATVVGALIITIMFASTFTVPGGNNQETGLPIFSGHISFQIFLIFNAISLAAASSSVLMFFGILTSRYAWEDFFKSLPLKLNLGLSLLFISIVTMMGAFCAAVFIMLQGQLRMVIPIVLLANAPAIFFIMLQFPLFLEIYNSTFRPGIFQKNISLMELLNKEISDIYDLSKDWTKKVNERCSSMQSSIKQMWSTSDDESEEVLTEN